MSNSVDREIRISASDNGVYERLQKLKDGATAMGRGIIEDAKKQATSSRELIKLMNDEIALIEKRNKLNKEAREMAAREKHTGGELKSELQKISLESKEDKMQSDLLKQILEAILKTSKEEITSDREGVRRKIRSDRDIDQMEDHEEALKQMMSKRLLEDMDAESKSGGGGASGRTSGAIGRVGSFIRETDAYTLGYSGAGDFLKSRAGRVENKFGKDMLMAGGLILGGAAVTIGAATDELEGLGDLSRSTGLSKSQLEAMYSSASVGTDLTDAQTFKRIAQLNIAGGGKLKPSQAANLLRFERSDGVDASQLAAMSFMGGGESTDDIFGMLKVVMGERGMSQAKTTSLLGAASQMANDQFMATGSTFNQDNIGILNTIMSNQKIKSPERAMATIGRANAMIQGGNTQLEAIKFSEFQKQTGGSYFDYLLEKEKGVAGQIDDMVVEKIMSGPGSADDKKRSLVGAGFSAHDAQEIVTGSGKVGPTGYFQGRYKSATSKAVSRGESDEFGRNSVTFSSAAVSNGFAEVGKASIDVATSLFELSETAIKIIKKWGGNSSVKTNTIVGKGATPHTIHQSVGGFKP